MLIIQRESVLMIVLGLRDYMLIHLLIHVFSNVLLNIMVIVKHGHVGQIAQALPPDINYKSQEPVLQNALNHILP